MIGGKPKSAQTPAAFALNAILGGRDMGQLQRQHEFDMPEQDTILVRKEQAHAIRRVLDAKTREVVGWLYEWNTGQLSVMWKDEARKNVVYE